MHTLTKLGCDSLSYYAVILTTKACKAPSFQLNEIQAACMHITYDRLYTRKVCKLTPFFCKMKLGTHAWSVEKVQSSAMTI